MAKFLQRLLEIDEPHFSVGMNQLEKATGHSGVDTRLIADITHSAHVIMRKLGLDPADSTGREVYQALISMVKRDTSEALLLDADYILLPFKDSVVSFNLIDVIENSHHELAYDQRIMSHGRRSLRGEIVQRYLEHPRTDDSVIRDWATGIGLLPEADKWYEANSGRVQSNRTGPLILSIGDIVTDAFIALREDQAEVTTDEHGIHRLSMEFGSKPPYDHVDIVQAVGNSANAAVSFTRLGLRASLMAFLGGDQAGKDSLEYLAGEKVDTGLVSVQQGLKSNYHFALRYGADRTILIKYEDYDYTWQIPVETPDWIYLSMISKSAWKLHEDLLGYLSEHPDIKLVFQPGTFHFEWGIEKLAAIYKRSYIVFMNREEAALVTGKGLEPIQELADGLHGIGPKIVVITDGPNGAYASDGDRLLVMPNYPDPAPPYDRTGAGDAFASTVVAALALGETLETALMWAPINSMSVVQKLGAQAGLLGSDAINQFLATAPTDYIAKEFKG
ncbi:carbohydrate kinase family protein [Candidatus Saccharibacteria bacterium]|nr:carbohydrate kinase family protein [Candidatus Saccharibacteria bacterium]